MHCPKCTEKGKSVKTKVIDSRLQATAFVAESIRRRRECPKCKHRFTTWETAMKIDSREKLSRIMKKRLSNIQNQAQKIVNGITNEKQSP